MLSRRRATVVVRANWWDGGRLEHLVSPHSQRFTSRTFPIYGVMLRTPGDKG